MNHSAQALPLAALLLDAQQVLHSTAIHSCRHSRGAAMLVERARFDQWRAQTLLRLTAAANDELPAPPAVA